MGASRRTLAALGLVAATIAACDALIGLGDYSHVDCAFNCPDAAEAGLAREAGPDAAGDVLEAGTPSDGSDAAPMDGAPDVEPVDAGVDEPPPVTLWAQWPMPNPDAAIAPDVSAPLPHPMAYDAGADGGEPTALDLVTRLRWQRAPAAASSIASAANACATLGARWQVPTRIQLVSLVDFTQNPTVDGTTFPSVPAQRLWTSSTYPSDAGLYYWFVDFSTGLTVTAKEMGSPASSVLCVSGP